MVRDRIDTCAAFVLVMSANADRSDWVAEEIDYARRQTRPILPLLLDGGVFFGFSRTQHDDVTGGALPSARFLTRLRALCPAAVPTADSLVTPIGHSVLPIYLACEQSKAMQGVPADAMNQLLAEFCATVASDPALNDLVLVGLLGFADRVEVLLPLSDLATVPTLPTLRPAGRCKLGPIVDVLNYFAEPDVKRLTDAGYRVCRPVVFLFGMNPHNDSYSWSMPRSGRNPPGWPARPNILTFALGQSDAAALARIATRPEYAYTSAHPIDALRQYVTQLTEPIVEPLPHDHPAIIVSLAETV